jgi:hypothetical protein
LAAIASVSLLGPSSTTAVLSPWPLFKAVGSVFTLRVDSPQIAWGPVESVSR